MRYYSSECPVLSATNGISYEISLCGCHFHCRNCQNAELQDFNAGDAMTESLINKIVDDIKRYRLKIDNIDIIGGEPLDQNHNEFINFLKILKKTFPELGIWVYTGYEISQVPTDVLELVDYIKCGQYIEELKSKDGFKSKYGPTLATSNQYIIKCSHELCRRNKND